MELLVLSITFLIFIVMPPAILYEGLKNRGPFFATGTRYCDMEGYEPDIVDYLIENGPRLTRSALNAVRSGWQFITGLVTGEWMSKDNWWERINLPTDDPRYVSVLKG